MVGVPDVVVVVAAPLEAPSVRVNGKPGCNEAKLGWNEIPQNRRRGFITNYTIFYTSETGTHGLYLKKKSHSFPKQLLCGRIGRTAAVYSTCHAYFLISVLHVCSDNGAS